jgi:hypothetical protein
LLKLKNKIQPFVNNNRVLLQAEVQQSNSAKFLPLITLAIISAIVFYYFTVKGGMGKNLN